VGDVKLPTRPLKAGTKVSLLGISGDEELLANGSIDITDTIDSCIALSCVYLNLPAIGRVVCINTPAVPGADMYYRADAVFGELSLTLKTLAAASLAREVEVEEMVSFAFGDVADAEDSFWRSFALIVELSMSGSVNTQTGDVLVNAEPPVLKGITPLGANGWNPPDHRVLAGIMEGASIIGYRLTAARSNYNHRQRT
jgi:hypothetical protein